jgi:hypothetical protein
MDTPKKYNKARIVPNKQAAGIKLGSCKATMIKHLGEPVTIEHISSHSERLEYDDVNVWIESGKVDQISVCHFYEGTTREGIGLGSTKTEVEDVYGAIEWDGTWSIQVPPFGIGFDFEHDLTGEQCVTEIFVFSQ